MLARKLTFWSFSWLLTSSSQAFWDRSGHGYHTAGQNSFTANIQLYFIVHSLFKQPGIWDAVLTLVMNFPISSSHLCNLQVDLKGNKASVWNAHITVFSLLAHPPPSPPPLPPAPQTSIGLWSPRTRQRHKLPFPSVQLRAWRLFLPQGIKKKFQLLKMESRFILRLHSFPPTIL